MKNPLTSSYPNLTNRGISCLIYFSLLLIFLGACTKPTEYDLSYSWSPVEISSEIDPSEEVESIIAPYRSRLDSIMDEVIGYSTKELTTEGRYESSLGTFVTELLYKQSAALYEQQVDAAIMNHHGGLRAPINEGPVTLGDIFLVMPFENEMLLLELSGEKLIEVIEFVASRNSSMIWPVGFEVHPTGIENIRLNGQEINPDQSYVLAVSDYQANGGSGFEMLQALKRIDVKPILLRDMIVREIRDLTAKGDSIQTEVVNAITVIN